MIDTAFVTSNIQDGIAEITFGTPKSNALPLHIMEELASTLLSVGEQDEVKAILLKSYGEKAFCAGASFDELLAVENLDSAKRFFSGFAKVLSAMKNCTKPIVVRVQGKVTGGGVGIVCAADYCLATEDAALALTELNIGIGPFVISPVVERKIGISEMTAMSLDAEFRTPHWAVQNHIYQHIFPSVQVLDEYLHQFMKKLAQKSTKALCEIKKLSWKGTEYMDELMISRALISAELLLKPEARKSILSVREKLREKQGRE